jgi:hypothetical protein
MIRDSGNQKRRQRKTMSGENRRTFGHKRGVPRRDHLILDEYSDLDKDSENENLIKPVRKKKPKDIYA